MQVDEGLSKRMIRDSAELGLEMFHIDAGWFRGVGDWYPDPKEFPRGLAAISDEAHQHGLKFGIWVDWAQAGTDTEPEALNVRDPKVKSWLVADAPHDWKPDPFVGRTLIPSTPYLIGAGDGFDPPGAGDVDHGVDGDGFAGVGWLWSRGQGTGAERVMQEWFKGRLQHSVWVPARRVQSWERRFG
jgi:hypothetical protein